MDEFIPTEADFKEYFAKNPQAIPALEAIMFYRLYQEEKRKREEVEGRE